jgi:hypothetical protein
VDAISIQSCDWWSLQLTSTACADYDAQCHPRQRDRPRPCPLRNDRRMAGLTSMDSSVCSSALALIACVGCHAHYRPGQRDRPIACPLRHDCEGYTPKGSVVILSAEDDAADTLVPRLMVRPSNYGQNQTFQRTSAAQNGSRAPACQGAVDRDEVYGANVPASRLSSELRYDDLDFSVVMLELRRPPLRTNGQQSRMRVENMWYTVLYRD